MEYLPGNHNAVTNLFFLDDEDYVPQEPSPEPSRQCIGFEAPPEEDSFIPPDTAEAGCEDKKDITVERQTRGLSFH